MSVSDKFNPQAAGPLSGDFKLTDAAIRLVQKWPGGLQSLMQHFRDKGLGDVFTSWISTTENEPLTPQDVQNVLGPSRLDALAQQSGLTPAETSEKLVGILPRIIDHLTPTGVIPEGDLFDQGVESLREELARR